MLSFNWIRSSIRNKLMLITGSGTIMLLGASLYGLWLAWQESLILPPDDAVSFQNQVVFTAGLMALAIVIAFITFLGLVQRNIISPARQLERDLNRLADGDFSQPVRHTTQDEIGEVALSAEKIRIDLGEIIQNVTHSTQQVSHAASLLASNAHSIVSASESQSEAAASTASAVEQVTQSVAQVADNAEVVRQQAHTSLRDTAQAERLLNTLAQQVNDAVAAMEAISGSVNDFLANTASITNMTQQVRDIADQTNLLALNAAIEAARAGEQGRGFAVVADEVRKLAEKSGQSANEIDAVTRALTQQSEYVHATIEQGRQLLQASHDNTRNATDAMGRTYRTVEESSKGIDAISTSVREQSTASENIAQNVERIASMAEENYSVVQQTSAAAGDLEALAGQLQNAVSKFRV